MEEHQVTATLYQLGGVEIHSGASCCRTLSGRGFTQASEPHKIYQSIWYKKEAGMIGQVHVVLGGQFGSEGKGSVVGWLTNKLAAEAREEFRPTPLVVRIGGPNAGHTVYDAKFTPWRLRTVPAGVVNPEARLAIAAGSEVEWAVLESEAAALAAGGHDPRGRLVIDNEATVLDDSHKHDEKVRNLRERIGSTAKGIGAARAERIMRRATRVCDSNESTGWQRGDTTALIQEQLGTGGDVIIETSQGFGLGLHAGFYPYCTSVDCRASDALAAAGIPPSPVLRLQPWVVCRTYPIRVAGNSGPLFGETTWEELERQSNGHIKPEKTTVTQLIRRVGRWDAELVRRAVVANGGGIVNVVISFLDYVHPGSYGVTEYVKLPTSAREWISMTAKILGCSIPLVTTGPFSHIEVPA